MQLEITAGYINLSFDDWEWKLPSQVGGKNAVLDFIQAIKDRIPKEDREYDPDNYIWAIKKEHLPAISEMRREFLQDKNQVSMF